MIGQILVKMGMLEVGQSPSELGPMVIFIFSSLTNLRVLLGLGCAIAAALTWIIAISRSSLSFAYPFMALTVVLVLIMSGVIFKENIPINRWIGVGIVCTGIIIASR